MKRLSLFMLVICVMTALPSSAQFGKLLDKAKAKIGGGGSGAGKKSGSFATVWESEFENKATRIAVVNGDGSYVVGSDDNSASVLDLDGKPLWNGDYKKLTTNKTNKSEYQYTVWKKGGGYLFFFFFLSLSTNLFSFFDFTTVKLFQKGTKAEEGLDQGELETVKYIDE